MRYEKFCRLYLVLLLQNRLCLIHTGDKVIGLSIKVRNRIL